MNADPVKSAYADRVHAWYPGFAPMPAPGGRNFPGLRAAIVAGPDLCRALEGELELVLVSLHREPDFGASPPAFLLVEGGPDGASGPGGIGALSRLVAQCRARGIPAVLWNTQDTAWAEPYRAVAGQFDAVFCADSREVEALRATGVDAEWLPPAIQPRLHNPFREFARLKALDTGVLYDGIVDLFTGNVDPALLRNAVRHGLKIIDSKSQVFASKLQELGDLRAAVLGCVDRDASIMAYKYARAALFIGAGLRTRTTQHWSVLEAAACRLPVIHVGRLEAGDPRREFVIEIDDPRELDAELDRIATDDLHRRRRGQTAWRAAQGAHTFSHRVRAIGAKLGIASTWKEYPVATVVTPTRRLELLSRCLDTYDRQRWPAKELVLVINRDSRAGAEALLARVAGRPDVRVTTVPEERYAGACMNAGSALATGDWCFRMDDDDYYGEHYLSDMMLHLRSVDADVVGKPPKYCHIEDEGRTWERRFRAPELTLLPRERCERYSLWLGGNTLGGRREVLLRTPYPELVFGAADTVFFMNAAARGVRIASLDDLNMVAARRGADAGHTWKVSIDDLKMNAREIGPGVDHVMV